MAESVAKSPRAQNWVWTFNNPPDDLDIAIMLADCKWSVWQKEQGEQETVHYQGYTVFKSVKTLKQLKKINASIHWEIRRGTHIEAKEYCQKTETRIAGPFCVGEEPLGKGARSDIMSLKRALDDGLSEKQIAMSDDLFPAWSRNFKGIERYRRLMTVNSRKWMTKTFILWGVSGTGKTEWTQAFDEDAYWLSKPAHGQQVYFDGYVGQETVVIDEFYGWLPFDLLCRMCDRYPLMVHTKGGMCNFYPKTIIITSNQEPFKWYKNGLGALTRRFSHPHGYIQETRDGWDKRFMICHKPDFLPPDWDEQAWQDQHETCSNLHCCTIGPVCVPVVAGPPLVDEELQDRLYDEQCAQPDIPDHQPSLHSQFEAWQDEDKQQVLSTTFVAIL